MFNMEELCYQRNLTGGVFLRLTSDKRGILCFSSFVETLFTDYRRWLDMTIIQPEFTVHDIQKSWRKTPNGWKFVPN